MQTVRSLAVLALVSACAPGPAPGPVPVPPTESVNEDATPSDEPPLLTQCPAESGLCFEVEPAGAELLVNSKSLGIIRDLGGQLVFVRLEPGIHMITLKLEGYVTWRAEVSVGGEAEKIQVQLEPKPEPEPELSPK